MNDAKPDVASLPAILRDRAKVSELRGHHHAQWSEGVRFAANQLEAALPKPASGDGLLADLELVWNSISDDKHTNAAYQRLRAALATHEQPGSSVQGEVVAWLTDDGRVISGRQKEAAIRDGGASASSVKPYSIPCYTTPPPAPAADQLKCPECGAPGLMIACIACSAHNYPPAPAAEQPEGKGDIAERLTQLLRDEMPSESIIHRCVELALSDVETTAPAAPGVRVDEAMANRFMRFFNCEAENTTGTRLYVTEQANVLNALAAALAPDGGEGE